MITLLMIPFFLIIRLSVDQDYAILNGAEYTYIAHVSITKVDEETLLRLKAFEMFSTLKCWPRSFDTLNCHFDNTKMGFYQQGLDDLGGKFIKFWDMSEDHFEIVFDRNGVSDLVVTETMSPWVIGVLRAIINQLNLGVDFQRKYSGESFDAIEKSYIGECETSIRISHKADSGEWNGDNFQIVPRFGFNKPPGQIMEIEKRRNLDKCAYKADYFFGSRDVSPTVYDSNVAKMTSSVSRILVADTNFTSYTINEIIVSNVNTGKSVKFDEKITLKMDQFVPT